MWSGGTAGGARRGRTRSCEGGRLAWGRMFAVKLDSRTDVPAIFRRGRAVLPLAAADEARGAVLVGEVVDRPRHIQTWDPSPRLWREALVGVQHHLAAWAGYVGRNIRQHRGPAKHRADEVQGGRMLGQVAEDRIAAQETPTLWFVLSSGLSMMKRVFQPRSRSDAAAR